MAGSLSKPGRRVGSTRATPDALIEIGEILARGLTRLRLRKSSPLVADDGESSLDCLGGQSGHAGNQPEKAER